MQHSGQIFSFVKSSRGVLRHALIRSHFLLKLINQVPSLCLLPRLAAKFRPFLACTLGYVDFCQNFNGRRFSIPQTISVFGITMRSLKLADSWYFETHCSHFYVTNPKRLSKRRAQTDNLRSINLPQLFCGEISTSLLQCTPSFTTKSLSFSMRLFR